MRVRWISLSADVPSENREPPIASISSMNITHGWWSLAYPNISRMIRELSPMYLSTIADATTLRKVPLIFDARARARRVFPVPGGPYKRTPLGALMPTRIKSSGFVSGNSITSRNSRTCSLRPPISEKPTPAASCSLSMLNTVGSTSLGIGLIIVRVVISNETRVPGFNLDLSSFVRHPTTYLGPDDAFTMNLSSSICFNTSPINCPTL
mmetsp:Transcript_3445/g.5379  ORF Transcript_3445/g.5379 Transcript_3445/m.5379 type:complete len:209 (-) Transcript_3445:236-862(-)